MYRNKKVGDACIVDLGSTIKELTTVSFGNYMSNINPATNGKSEVCETFKVASDIGVAGATGSATPTPVSLGVILPKLGRSDNISLSVFGSVYMTAGNVHIITPFIASEGSTEWSGQSSEELGNRIYLPHQNNRLSGSTSITFKTDIILKDMGYGMDLKDKGIAIGFEINSVVDGAGPQNVLFLKGTLSARYNYSPIKTLDQEV
jgi:hypothetical protein